MSFYQSAQPIVIPDPTVINPSVQSVTAGSNVSITGTAADPIVNVPTGANGSSATNVPIPSSAPETPVTENINNGSAVLFYTILPEKFPQPTVSSDYVYRFTFMGYITIGEFAEGTPGGNICVKVSVLGANGFERDIGGSAAYASPTVTQGLLYSFSIIFQPVLGDTLKIRVLNTTGGNLTNVVLTPAIEGCGIELVSTASAPALIFS